MTNRKAFTLIEVLISIVLLGMMLPVLFSVVAVLQDSNDHLLTNIKKAQKISQATKTFYIDIMGSDGNITLKKDEFTRVCMEETQNSLYGLSTAKVCWVVLKKDNTLVRIEGNGYKLPVGSEEKVEVDTIMKHVEIFDIYHEKDKVLVLIKQDNKEPISFMLQGVTKAQPKKKKIVPVPGTTTPAPTTSPSSGNSSSAAPSSG